MSDFENFDAVYAREREVQEEFEKIELAYAKTAEKYKGYAECIEFAHYLKTVEKIFAEAKIRKQSMGKVKDSLIQAKIAVIAGSEKSALDESILKGIYDEFKKHGNDISKVKEAADKLIEKYREDEDCVDFISYIENIMISFEDFQEGNLNMMDVKTRLVEARMKVLSSDGNPEFKTLENIFVEFKELLK